MTLLDDPQHRSKLSKCYRDGLLNDVLPFWLAHAVDDEYGGIMSSVDRDGTTIDTDKSVWQQGRFTWLLGEMFNDERLSSHPDRDRWLDVATQNLEFISKYCFDTDDGRMWFHMTRDGHPLRKRRYSFGESFAAIAFGEIAQAVNSDEFAEQAESCFHRFINASDDSSGIEPKFTETRPTKAIGKPMIAIATAQQLRDSIGLESADQCIDKCIAEIENDFVKDEFQCVMETVGPNGEFIDHFDGRTLNPGHAIEAAWFIMLEGQTRQKQEWIHLGAKILDWSWQRGWDAEYGGLLYFVDARGLPVQEYWHDMKFWWPHNEAIIATLMAWHLTRDAKYSKWHQMVHDWSYHHFPDCELGEWYGYLNRQGQPTNSLKGNLWKGPFHLPRMQLVCWRIVEEIQSSF